MICMKIFRLSLFNLKKNKKEALAIIFLTFITVFTLGIVAANLEKVRNVFDECFEATGSVKNIMVFRSGSYRDEYEDILKDEYKITDIREGGMLFGINSGIRNLDGTKSSDNLILITEDGERKIEDFVKGNSLSDEEIKNAKHPVWLPQVCEIGRGYKPGDTFTVVAGGRDYQFTVAGFYETGICNNSNVMIKVIITESDYTLLSGIFEETKFLAFDYDTDFPRVEFIGKCEEKSSDKLTQSLFLFDYAIEKYAETQFPNMFMIMAASLSIITMVAAIFLIRHKIGNDIEDQMQQIGVLESLGYTSREISLSYIYEYVITVGIGAVIGAVAAVASTPLMNSTIRSMIGREVRGAINVLMVAVVAVILTALITLFALLKARSVKKYPPVVAFRKGIKTHHFGRNVLPLAKTKSSINVRLALKSLVRDVRQNIGTGFCIALAALAFLFCVYSFDIFKNGYDVLMSVMGLEVSDETLTLLSGVDAYEFSEELSKLEEVDKALPTYNWKYVHCKGYDDQSYVNIFDDFSKTENLFAVEGRFPQHDNEIAISLRSSRTKNLYVGDSIVVEGDSIEKSYVITGVVGCMSNSGQNVYLTCDGYRRICPNKRPDGIDVYLKDGYERDDFEKKIVSIYGASAADMAEGAVSGGTLEERIRQKADEKIALLLTNYGVTSVDYAVKVGDKMITGNSSKFVIKDISSLYGLAESQMGAIADATRTFTLAGAIFIAVVVAVILWIISASNVRRQRKELGIMKSMGYSSRDLMKQMAIKAMPVTVIAVVIASALSFPLQSGFWFNLFAADMGVNVPLMIVLDIAIVIYCYVVTYICAGRIKKISVTELMTE